MQWLSEATLVRLRDRLRERGQRPSIVMPDAQLPPSALELLHITAEYGPLCEAMYLMMAADGRVTHDEREVLRGALRTLSADAVRTSHVEALLDASSKQLAAEGRSARLQAVVAAVRDDPVHVEVTFVLTAAVAFADDAITDEENDLLNELAEQLGIDEQRARELLDTVDREFASATGGPSSTRGRSSG